MESFLTFLFKFRPLLFQNGELVLGTPWPMAVLATLAGGVGLLALATYGRRRGAAAPRYRLLLGGLRAAVLGLLLLCLFQPTLVISSTVPQRNFVGILVDDSRSMTLPAADGRPRSAFVAEHFGGEESELVRRLSERFALRFFGFSSSASRLQHTADLRYDGTRTDLPGALERARNELSSVPLSGLVVLTDGGDNVGGSLEEAMVPLQAASVPVYAVGLGEEVLEPDLQVGRVEVPRRVMEGTSLGVDVMVTGRGFGGRSVPLLVEDEDRILAREEVEPRRDGEPTVVRVSFTLERPGFHRIRFRVPPQDGEAVRRNNERSVLVEVRPDRQKILYFEGEPRFEVKFVRRAVQDDENVQLVILQRTAENKFLRLDVDDGRELAGGFPRTREELFRYQALILGSVEASFFTHDQLDMIADFVSQRGGGLLVLGGRSSLAEGGYEGTPLAEALPVFLEEPAPDPRAGFTELRVRPTVAGLGHPAVRIRPAGRAGPEAWDSLPPLSTLNRVVRVKPGATTLLEGRTEEAEGARRVVLAQHRYGRGKVAAFPVQDSWMWQMHADVPLDDSSHEIFWQQLLRWLLDGVPDPVDVGTSQEAVEAGEEVEIRADVRDSTHLGVNDARVSARVTAPDGSERTVDLQWTLDRDGLYTGRFHPEMDGDHQIAVEAVRADSLLLGSSQAFVRVGPSDREYFDAGQRRPLLERLARETGGRYYTADTAGDLPEDIRYTGAGVTLTEEHDLWDMPAVFLVLVLLLGAEWGLRRRRKLI